MAVTAKTVAEGGDTLKGKPGKHPCPHCTYAAMTAGSLGGHIAMKHPDEAQAAANGAAVEAFEATTKRLAGLPEVAPPQAMLIRIAKIEVADNVRVDLGDLVELTASIREHGIQQPITVTVIDADRFRVLQGHRRLAAAAAAGYDVVPAIVETRAELGHPGARRSVAQLVENLQREDLNLLEAATSIDAILKARKDLSQADVARWLGKDRSWVSNALRLLETAPEVQEAVRTGVVSPTHARAIAAVDVDLQAGLLNTVVKQGLSAHSTETQAKYVKDDAKRIRARKAEVERRTAETLDLLGKVANKAKATISIESYSGIGSEVIAALKADGWTVESDGWRASKIANAGECGCTAWIASLPYNANDKVELKPACVSKEHAEARRAAVDAKWRADQEAGNAQRRAEKEAAAAANARLTGTVAEVLAEQPATPLGRRLVIYAVLAEEPEDELAERYLGKDAMESLYEDEDPGWKLVSSIPDEDLGHVLAKVVAQAATGYNGGPGIRAALEARMKGADRTQATLLADEPAAEPETAPKAAKKAKRRVSGTVHMGDPVLVDGVEYTVFTLAPVGDVPTAQLVLKSKSGIAAKDWEAARRDVAIAELVIDETADAWRFTPADPSAVQCVGSNHVPGHTPGCPKYSAAG